MTTQVAELYQALRSAGVADDLAQKAASAVISISDKEQIATKADLFALETRLTRTLMTTMLAMTAIFGAISAALRFVK